MSLQRVLLVAAAQAACLGALAQDATQAAAIACPQATAVGRQHLLGLWRAEFEGLPQGATLLLEAHPEFAESVRGAINRNGERALVAGDVEDGEFTLEESLNGTNISAVWVGDVAEGSCGREIRGAWKAEGKPRQWPFVLRKMP